MHFAHLLSIGASLIGVSHAFVALCYEGRSCGGAAHAISRDMGKEFGASGGWINAFRHAGAALASLEDSANLCASVLIMSYANDCIETSIIENPPKSQLYFFGARSRINGAGADLPLTATEIPCPINDAAGPIKPLNRDVGACKCLSAPDGSMLESFKIASTSRLQVGLDDANKAVDVPLPTC